MLQKLFLLFLLLSSLSFAFVSVSPPNIGADKTISSEISIGADYSKGNSNNSFLSLGLKGQYNKDNYLFYLLSSYAYKTSNNLKNKNEGLVHLRYIQNINNSTYDYEIFIQSEFNEFQKIKKRNLLGANIRKSFSLGFDSLYLGLGTFYSYTEPKNISNATPIYKQSNMNSYISFVKKVNPYLSFNYLGFYQANIADFSDFKAFQILQLSTHISKNISLSLDFKHTYSSKPYIGIKKADFYSTINLRYKLK